MGISYDACVSEMGSPRLNVVAKNTRWKGTDYALYAGKTVQSGTGGSGNILRSDVLWEEVGQEGRKHFFL